MFINIEDSHGLITGSKAEVKDNVVRVTVDTFEDFPRMFVDNQNLCLEIYSEKTGLAAKVGLSGFEGDKPYEMFIRQEKHKITILYIKL